MNRISVFSEEKRFGKFERALKKTALLSFKDLKKDHLAVEIFLISDPKMKKLNCKFRNKNKTTNILSFEVPSGMPRPDLGDSKFIGEIFLAPDHVEEKKEELGFLLVHGILHLLGYTHSSERNAIMMNKLEHKIWNKICQKS